MKGLETREYERAGSVIRRSDNKRIITWLRDHPTEEEEGMEFHGFLSILYADSELNKLKPEDLLNFVRFIHEIPELYNLNFYGGRRSMTQVLKKYDNLLDKKDTKETKSYAKEKREPILNLFNMSFLPQLRFRLTADMLWLDDKSLLTVLKEERFSMTGKKGKSAKKSSKKKMDPSQIDVTFEISDKHKKDLKKKVLERVGGVLREMDTKKIVIWLNAIHVDLPGEEAIDKDEATFRGIIRGKRSLNCLSDMGMLELARWLSSVKELSESKYGQPLKNALKIVIIHDKLKKRDGEDKANEYASAKRISLLHLLGRSFLPNMQAAFVRGEIKPP